MKLHIKIKSITYILMPNDNNPLGINSKTKCIIRWINPITGNIQRSVGVSRCNSIDKFNEIKGQRIAESRAKINMWKTYNLAFSAIVKDTLDRHFKFICYEEQHLRNLINDVKTK